MQDPVLIRSDTNGIATVTLNRGDKFNALSDDLLDALQAEIDALAADRSVRVVVVAGTGRAFCAGHDLGEMREKNSLEAYQDLFGRCAQVMLGLTRLPQPVIARVHGLATAAGCQLVAQCDLAIAAEGAKFAVSGINVGLFCSTPGVALARNLPRKTALEMLFTGDFVDARTALELGLVNRVVPAEELDDAVAELTDKILAKSPLALRLGKQAFYRQIEQDLADAYDIAARAMADNAYSEDTRAGIDAFIDKRPMPDWKGH